MLQNSVKHKINTKMDKSKQQNSLLKMYFDVMNCVPFGWGKKCPQIQQWSNLDWMPLQILPVLKVCNSRKINQK